MRVAFSGFLLDSEARRLTREGRDVHLSPKAFDLLVLLIEARPAVVEKAAIRARLWPNVHVVEASLTNLVTEIRGELGSEVGTRLIRTVHGVGYAFAGDLREAGNVAASSAEGRESPYLFVLHDRPIVLRTGPNVIGREPVSAVWVDSDSVSRRHAIVRVPERVNEADVTIEDLGSTNGTYVGGRRIAAVVSLEDGERVRVGEITLTFRARPAGEGKTRKVKFKPLDD